MLKGFTIGATAALALGFAVSSAQAEVVKYHAKLDGKSEVPANESKGTGTAKLSYDTATKKLKYELDYKGLTDAVAAHFHGPADAGANAPPPGVELPITFGPSPIKGEADLTDAQAADLAAGKWYVNIHTKGIQAGEIRGQVEPVKKK